MKKSKYLFIVLALTFIAAFPYKAYTGEIPFSATYPIANVSSNPGLTIACTGPWSRSSSLVHIPVGATEQVFYKAKETIFSPYGNWNCSTFLFPNPFGVVPPPVAETSFTLRKGLGPVRLTMTSDSLFVNLTEDSNTISAKATLGDDNNNKRRERDTWNFQGSGGDTVLITLEEDPESGHSGEEATLMLKNGSSTIETSTDALPIEIMATLPSDGEYELVVEQHGIAEDVRFRGDYYLSIESTTAEVEEIRPTLDVEQ